jgi:hypothetical protein
MTKLDAAQYYRMPVCFGPALGPRQSPDGRPFDWVNSPKRTSVCISFLSTDGALQRFLPPGFSLCDEPEVTIELQFITELEWLAGRGYNTMGLRFPAQYKGSRDHCVGFFLVVLWENLADPIITGRDDLGFNKLYCEIPEPRVVGQRRYYSAGWLGHPFFELELCDLKEQHDAQSAVQKPARRNDGLLHYKYVPRTGTSGEADVAYATLTPSTGSNAAIKRIWRGSGSHSFKTSTWEQLPTLFKIVNAFADLPVLESRGTVITEIVGGKDLSDQRRLE